MYNSSIQETVPINFRACCIHACTSNGEWKAKTGNGRQQP